MRNALSSSDAQLTRELVEYFQTRYGDQAFYHSRNLSGVGEFWAERGIEEGWYNLPPDLTDRMERIESQAQEEVAAVERAADYERASGVVGDCVRWARERQLRKITQQDAELFLLQSGIRFSIGLKRTIWLMANDELRR